MYSQEYILRFFSDVHRLPGLLAPPIYWLSPNDVLNIFGELGTLFNEQGRPFTGHIQTTNPLDHDCLESGILTTWPLWATKRAVCSL